MLEKVKETIDLARQDKKLQGNSDAWVNWEAVFSLTTCKHCLSRHGSILAAIEAKKRNGIPAHKNCCCAWVPMRTRVAGRVWYEADINYESGFRNRQRILYSNDGLVFASYDHYHTFYEITK